MNIRSFVAVMVGSVLFALSPVQAQETKDPQAQLGELVDQIREKLQQGQRTEAALAGEIKRFDELLAEHAGEKTDEVAQIGRASCRERV